MKILIPSLGFSRSGGGRVLCKFADHWIGAGHTTEFLVNDATSAPYFPTRAGVRRVTNSGVEARTAGRAARSARFSGWRNLVSLYRALGKIGGNYDVLLANHSLTAWPLALASCGRGCKFYYVQAYEPEVYSLEPGLKPRVLEWMAERSYRFDLVQICNAPVYVGYKSIRARDWVPPAVDFDLFRPRPARRPLEGADEIVLGCIGRREPYKGIRDILRAFEFLWREDHRFRLRVAYGNLPAGWSHPGLEVAVPEDDAELAEYYRSLDVLIAPGTIQIGAPHYPVMEAMACGVPVITTGYLPANPSNAWIVPVRDPAAIAVAARAIVADRESREVRVARALSDIRPFTWDAASQKMLLIFEEGLREQATDRPSKKPRTR